MAFYLKIFIEGREDWSEITRQFVSEIIQKYELTDDFVDQVIQDRTWR